MLDYIFEANLQSINFTPEDIYWGQLTGCFEALDAGTTCVVDNAHMSTGPKHGSTVLSATVTSGIRSIFCYGAMPLRAAECTETSFELDRDPMPEWLLSKMDDFASRTPFRKHGRVQLGFFLD
ncbi:hypothetical protein FZEAL_8337 [Fusarium zealandicum]|uniref:Uncharacterized protein n=1 Tax=Fusarium zealandicum TaxID=1053134 RepID=A0A8H4XHS3_9HYPO|nr:hypothetical protein FZEAL_8337 [Fusarium zealandicum]